MAVAETLLKFKFHLIAAAALAALVLSVVVLAPSFVTVISYFWPLFLSTALFLVAVVFFGRISPLPHETSGEKAGEGLLDYVAGQPEPPHVSTAAAADDHPHLHQHHQQQQESRDDHE